LSEQAVRASLVGGKSRSGCPLATSMLEGLEAARGQGDRVVEGIFGAEEWIISMTIFPSSVEMS